MATVQHLLLVDDSFEVLELVKTALEGRGHKVTAVPSAEEALLEFRPKRFQMVITDARLPGMSGFDLARRVKRMQADLPVVMISGYGQAQGGKAVPESGITHYFGKPLDMSLFLKTIEQTLLGETAVTPIQTTSTPVTVPDEIRKRLDLLRTDTGAPRLVLGSVTGAILFESGSARQIDVGTLIPILAQSMASSLNLADHLKSNEPFTLLYQIVGPLELYSVNLGKNYFATLLFDFDAKRGRMGAVLTFVQRAVKDLYPLLSKIKSQPSEAQATAVATPPPTTTRTSRTTTPPPTSTPTHSTPPPPTTTRGNTGRTTRVAPPPRYSPPEPSAVVNQPTTAKPTTPEPSGLNENEAAKLVNLVDQLQSTADPSALSAIFDAAIAASEQSGKQTMSFEEMRKLGLDLSGVPFLPPSSTPEATLELEPVQLSPEELAKFANLFDVLPPTNNEEPAPPAEAPQLSAEELAKFASLFESPPAEAPADTLDDFWETAVTNSTPSQQSISLADAQKLGLGLPAQPTLPPAEPSLPPPDPAALAEFDKLFANVDTSQNSAADFWDTALADESNTTTKQGISLEEARRLGLVPGGGELPKE